MRKGLPSSGDEGLDDGTRKKRKKRERGERRERSETRGEI
jgi:hypothetical protein